MAVRWLLAVLCCLASAPALAADLTVRFTGRFLPGTCQFSVADIDLGTFDAPFFDTRRESPAVPFVLKRSNCTTDLRTLHVRFVGTADGTSADHFAIPTAGGVRGLAVRIQSQLGELYAPNRPAFDWQTNGGAFGERAINALLIRTGATAVTAGTIRTPITVQVTYN